MLMACVSADDVKAAVDILSRIYAEDIIHVINYGALSSALYVSQHGAEHDPLREASLLIYYITTSHPLSDGNKRLAFTLASLCLLRHSISFDRWRMRDIIIDAASGILDQNTVVRLLRGITSEPPRGLFLEKVSVDDVVSRYKDVLDSLRLYDMM